MNLIFVIPYKLKNLSYYDVIYFIQIYFLEIVHNVC